LFSINPASFFGITGEEYEEKLKLEEEKRVADEKYRYKRRQVRELQEYLQVKHKQKFQSEMAATRSSIHTNHLIKRRGNSGTAFASFSFTTYSLYQYMQLFFFYVRLSKINCLSAFP